LRDTLEIHKKELARRVGITNTTLYKYEKNKCEPRSEIISNLANELNTSADYLIGRTKDSGILASAKVIKNVAQIETRGK
jgi:transcriptional regulator with XRE-family HTH domain